MVLSADESLLWCSTFEAELADVIPVVKVSIAGTRVIGRMCVGEINYSQDVKVTLLRVCACVIEKVVPGTRYESGIA